MIWGSVSWIPEVLLFLPEWQAGQHHQYHREPVRAQSLDPSQMRSSQVTECPLELEEHSPGVNPALGYYKQWGQGNSCKREGGKSQAAASQGSWRSSCRSDVAGWLEPAACGSHIPCTYSSAAHSPWRLPCLLASLSCLFLPWSGRLHAQGRVLDPD